MKRTRPSPHFKFPDEITIEVAKMNEADCQWFGAPIGSYSLRCINYGWFPNDVIMTVDKGKYVDGYNIGAHIIGNMGTASIAVVSADKAIELLKDKGYKIQII